jgi:hypothetical protein
MFIGFTQREDVSRVEEFSPEFTFLQTHMNVAAE